jgi:hypothetical protein
MRQSDIEIYIHCRDLATIVEWLEARFGMVDILQADQQLLRGVLQLDLQSKPCEFLLLQKAAGAYTSVWFKQNETPWNSDIDCGRDAFNCLQREVRVSAGEWAEGDEYDSFVRIRADGESSFLWNS